MSDRETKKLTTPSGKEVELKAYLNTKERNEFRLVFLKHSKLRNANERAVIDQIEATAVDEAEHKIIQIAVISYDDSSERILERLLEGSPDEYDFVVEEATKSVSGNFQKAK